MNELFVRNILLKFCGQPRDFDFLSKNTYGLDPIHLQEYLLALEKEGLLKRFNGGWVIKGYRTYKKKSKSDNEISEERVEKFIPYFNIFKKPHPLDFEWRNSLTTLNFLSNFISNSNTEKDKVLLLGMPSLFISTFLKRLPQQVVLVDKNEALLSSVSDLVKKSKNHTIIQNDVFKIDPSDLGKFNYVFIDPPWYSTHFFHFIWLASQCLEVGGSLAISLPPINIRPNIVSERQQWFLFCEQQGLYLEDLLSQRMEYVMPFFEFNALRAAGLKDILPFWRRGDLAIFKKIENKTTVRPDFQNFVSEWKECDIDGVRFRVNTNGNINEPLLIDHIVKGDILPSVSSRDSRRQEANVWTSGNRIFNVNNPQAFLDLVELYKNERRLPLTNSSLGTELIKFVVEIEQEEYNNYTDWIQYEMENKTSEEVKSRFTE